MAERKTNGAAISALRKALGISQEALAGRANISAPYLSQIENAGRQPAEAVTRRLSDELGVALDAISYPVHDCACSGQAAS